MTPSPEELGYRTKITFAMQRGRIGYHPINEPTRIFDVRDCLLAHPALRRLHAAVRAARTHLPSDDARVVLRLDQADGLHVIVITPAAPTAGLAGAHCTARCRLPASMRGLVAAGGWYGHARWLGPRIRGPRRSSSRYIPRWGDRARVPRSTRSAMIGGLAAWDLYAGIGETTSRACGSRRHGGKRGERSRAPSRSPNRAVRRARVAWSVAWRMLRRRWRAPDVVVTNPPRTGMAPGAIDALLRVPARRIAYISCDPATLARDLAPARSGLSPGRRCTAFDQFPQTAHLESLAVLERP